MVGNLPFSRITSHCLGFFKKENRAIWPTESATLGIGSRELPLSASLQTWLKNFHLKWTESATFEDYFMSLACPEEVVLSISALDFTPVTSKNCCFLYIKRFRVIISA